LISLVWALELVVEPSKTLARKEFVMAPGGREIRLDSVAEASQPKGLFSRGSP